MISDFYADIISIDELCELLAIGRNTAYKLLNNGDIKGFKIGRNWKIPRKSVEEYVMDSCAGK